MFENKIKKDEPVQDGNYRAWYRCTNCGVIFQYDLRKGTLSSEMKGECPWCATRSGTPKAGTFPLMKYNPQQDQIQQRNYFV